MAGAGHVGVDLGEPSASLPPCPEARPVKTYPTVGTVGAPALLRGLVDLDVLDNQIARVEALGVRVRLGVSKEREEVLRRLDGPPSTGDTELLSCLLDTPS